MATRGVDLTNDGAGGPRPDLEGMDRGVGFFGLLWSCEGSLIGSGWLFGALTAVTIGGPSVLIAWGIATAIVILLALVHAELGGLFPVTGGTSRFPYYAFGGLAGATFGWFSYIYAAAVTAVEVAAVLQYASSYHWARGWYGSDGSLHGPGIPIALGLLALTVVINVLGVRWFARINNAFTLWKVAIPLLAIVVLLVTHFHGSNFHAGGGFFAHDGGALKNILVAIPAGGIVFSFLGFEQSVQLAGEARDPKDVPRTVIASIVIAAVLYIVIQVAFIAALEPSLLAKAGTWTNLGPTNSNPAVQALNGAPFFTVAKTAGLLWLAVILRLDATISPGATALIYTAVTSRLSFGLSRNGYLPPVLARNSRRTKVPVVGIVVAGVIGAIFLLPFPSWGKLVGVVTDAAVMMYVGAPLALGALRRQKPDLPRFYRLPAARVLAPTAFALASLIVYWTGWPIYSTLMVVVVLGYVIMFSSRLLAPAGARPAVDWRPGMFLLPYMIGLGIISYLGQFPTEPAGIIDGVGVFATVAVGGTHAIPFGWDFAVVIAFSVAIYAVAIHFRLSPERVDHNVREVYSVDAHTD